MQSNTQFVREALAVAETGNMQKLSGLVTEDMTFESAATDPLSKTAYLALLEALLQAIPNWQFDPKNFIERGNKVSVTLHINGTHTATLTLPMLAQPLPATGKHFQSPPELCEFTFKSGKISRIVSQVVPGGGVRGLLAQLGAALPTV